MPVLHLLRLLWVFPKLKGIVEKVLVKICFQSFFRQKLMFLICLVAFSFFPILAEINGPRNTNLSPKSLLRSPAAGDFYATGIEIWAGFGPVLQLLRPGFSCFHGQKKNILKHCRWLKHFWHRMKLRKYFFFLKKFKKNLGSDTFSIVSCTIRDPSPRDFSIMTLRPKFQFR